jgi:hypothetical protein
VPQGAPQFLTGSLRQSERGRESGPAQFLVVRDLGNRPVRLELLEALLARKRDGRCSVVDQPVSA